MKLASKKILLVVLIVVGLAAIYFSFFKTEEHNSPADEHLAEASASVYISSLRDLEGRPVAMDQSKLIFVNVWATWCGPCNMEMPGIQTLYDKYKGHDKIAFYIISDEDAETVNPFIQRKGYDLPFYQYAGAYPSALDGNAIPRTYIIYKGQILAQEIGASRWDRPEIIELIDKHLSEI
jgi:thiol-disulfide isomerase/thioredoxin